MGSRECPQGLGVVFGKALVHTLVADVLAYDLKGLHTA